ncbi:valine--tRNA ligase [Mycoplasma iguanae]|uniref:Valine--tRNA ligase n=1 Tax=Mycoplasma iguanae TaxID=292461 RepID=A0ABY5R7V7_9MOLU|nr:valine--tRNA ligase [Mycoplasma iguanae]UVD81593.1 valine--tRNA ligase [Mycoplasma iguanae]
MEKKYNHHLIECDKNQKWIEKKFFSTHDLSKPPFAVILPPPNVTGKLHIGHAWNSFIQDTVIRYKKLQGFDVKWVPGMDHAGISTQAKIAQKLAQENIFLKDITRKEFLEHAWKWKDEYSQLIRDQWAKMGLALDYDAERFTLDSAANEAVNKVFIDLYNQGLIYRSSKAINWDPIQKTALSNIEVISEDTKQKMYYIKYFLENSEEYLIISTTRAETLYSDVAVAVHPSDEKYQKYIGKNVKHPLSGKIIPIIGDEYINPSFGTGVMKVSAHATQDIEIIQKNNLEILESIDQSGKMNSLAQEFVNLDRFEARKQIAKKLQKNNFLVKTEEIISPVGYSERSKAAIEILVSPQWFVKMDLLTEKVLANLNSNHAVNFFPGRFKNTMHQWMEKIYDWTISRQLIWGHRIPAWYKGDEIKVQLTSPGDDWTQDPDVLDTWFSSALSPFVFLGWPQTKAKVEHYYPTSLLVTGWDILFFWVARMYFFSLHFMDGQIPFKDVLLHGLIRDEQGRKMSKSLGNGIDPMEIIDQYGADSLRNFLLWNSTPGQDLRFSKEKLEAAWNVNNKLWNISRYIFMMNDATQENTGLDQWIINKLENLKSNIAKYFESYEFTLMGKEIQKFLFDDFSSWYIELSKANPNKKTALLILKHLLVVLHPFMPFLTDHIYREIFHEELLESNLANLSISNQVDYIDDIIEIVKTIREFREKYNISKKIILQYYIKDNSLPNTAIEMINNLTKSQFYKNNDSLIQLSKFKLFIKLNEEFKQNESKRITEQINFLENEIKRSQSILSNAGFIAKAPAEKINLEKAKLADYQAKLNEYLKLIKGNNE